MKHDVFLSTFSHDATKEIAHYGIGIEFNHFCISKWLDGDVIDDTLDRMRRQAVRCGVCLPAGEAGRQEAGLPAADADRSIDSPDADPPIDPVKAVPPIDPVKAVPPIDPAKAIVHGPFTDLAPAAFDHRFRQLTRDRLDQAAEGTLRLGLSRMVVHTGYIPLVFDPRWQVKESVVFWREFLEDKPEDFVVLLENVMDEEPALLLDIVEGVDDPRMRICLDVGHVNAISPKKVTEWIEALGPQIRHFHLHNNDGRRDLHAPLTEGTLDMEEVLRAVDACCVPETTLTIESRDCHDSIRWLLDRL